MNELIKVDNDTQLVSARELHKALEIEKRFSAWFETNSQGFVEGEDFTSVLSSTVVNNGAIRELDDYACSIDMAKHICLMSRTEKGKECRQYLIDLEKAWNTPEQIMARALRVADQTISSLNQKVLEMQPKAEFFDAVTDSKTAIPIGDVAKVLDMGIGRNKLFEFLRDEKILMNDNSPYQKYIDLEYFRVIEQKYEKNGDTYISLKTLVFQKGINFIRKRLSKVVENE